MIMTRRFDNKSFPSSYVGGPRCMHQQTQDAMDYIRKFGQADLFLTFTFNPKWLEISNELFKNQNTHNQHDIIARVFHEKQNKLFWLLKEVRIFGELNAWITTIEWQKRGLPHSQTLIWCKLKIRGKYVDKIISTELPDKDDDPELFETIKTQLIHGLCRVINPDSPCMQEKCIKQYPNLMLEKLRLTMMDIPFTADISQNMGEN